MDTLSWPYEARHCTRTDEEETLELLAITVGETAASKKTAAYWRWKHFRNPYGESYSVCARERASGMLAGLRTMMRWSFTDAAGLQYHAARAVDTATHPLHQRRGIFSQLTRFALDELAVQDVPFIFNTPNRNSLPGYLKMGWTIVARWPLLLRPVRPLRAATRWMAARAAVSPSRSDDGTAASNLAGGDFPTWSDFQTAFGSEVEHVVQRHEAHRHQVGLRSVRNLAYLSWRYGAHPDVAYSVFITMEGSRLAGFAVGRAVPSRRGLLSLVITELFLADPAVRTASELIRRIVRSTRADYVVAHAAAGTLEVAGMRRTGFVRLTSRGYTFTARPLTGTSLDPTVVDSWDLTLGDLEIF